MEIKSWACDEAAHSSSFGADCLKMIWNIGNKALLKWRPCFFFEFLQKAASTWRWELLLINDQLILEEQVSQTSVFILASHGDKRVEQLLYGKPEEGSQQ